MININLIKKKLSFTIILDIFNFSMELICYFKILILISKIIYDKYKF